MNRSKTTKLLGITGIIGLIVLLFPPSRYLWLAVYGALRSTFGFVIDLLQIGLIAFIFAAFLAPLEALGWWAGWYGDEVKTVEHPGVVERPVSGCAIARYIIYLDGIGQATYKYLPDVETFLDRLEATLPENVLLLRGIMPYSVMNLPLTEDRLLSFLWRFADYMQVSRYGSFMGTLTSLFINLRNVLIVSVSADGRYGPIFNQGIAQVIYNGLSDRGYEPGSGVPITLMGFSGGGQIAMGALPFLKRALKAPIEVISIAGVISGNTKALELEHLYHLVGNKDPLERLGAILFPKRWKVFFLSYWNRAKRKGKISIISLGPVGHSGPGSSMDDKQCLPDGRTCLQQTLDLILAILNNNLPEIQKTETRKPSNYELYQQAVFNQPSYYPLDQSVDEQWYQAIAPWIGRLILPKLEQRYTGVLLEVHHAPSEYKHLVGQVVNLRWSKDASVQNYVRAVTKDIYFSEDAKYSNTQGIVHPIRLKGRRQVDPLQSLAGARPNDDAIVKLAVEKVEDREVFINREPVQITGRFYGLVRFVRAVGDDFQVIHFNSTSRQFDGIEEVVKLPKIIADQNGICNSSNRNLEKSPLNQSGWYIYGAKENSGVFVVQAIAPRSLLQLQPDEVIFGKRSAFNYLKYRSWSASEVPKGQIKSVLLSTWGEDSQAAIQQWEEGDYALVVHTYGGIGGRKAEPPAKGPIYFGHFAYGVAQVVREPLTNELRFDIEYRQVYTHNIDGLIAGTLHWSRYLGDRQFGWVGVRPVCDLLIKLDAFTEDFNFDGVKRSALASMVRQLDIMTARYRTGDGTGGTYVGAANNCSQDSNQALYATLKRLMDGVKSNSNLQDWLRQQPEQANRFAKLVKLANSFRDELMPFGTARADWKNNSEDLGLSLEDDPLKNILRGLVSWRTLFPRVASDAVAQEFLRQGAMVWVLRTNQIGGDDPDIEAIAPFRF